jgi:hypothetical protein
MTERETAPATETPKEAPTMKCYGQTRGQGWQQEWYETASRDAGRRARQVFGGGRVVSVGAMGSQVTGVGSVRMTLVTIRGNLDGLPAVEVVRL